MNYQNDIYHTGVKGMKWGHRRAQKTATKLARYAGIAERYKNDSQKKQMTETIIFGASNRHLSVENYSRVKNLANLKYKDVSISKYTKDGHDYVEATLRSEGKKYVSEYKIGQSKGTLNSDTETGTSLRKAEQYYTDKIPTGNSYKKARTMAKAAKMKRLADAYDVK